MNSPQQNVSDDPQTIRCRRSSRLSADELLLNLPIDLTVEIFSKLPLKSIARSRCISKRWASVLRSPDFTELFFTKSSARPKLLFARQEDTGVIFFSSPQPQNPDDTLSTISTVDHQISVPFEAVQDISSCVNGYLCITDYRMSKETETEEFVYVICNPSTGHSFTLPKTRKRSATRNFLGYDPVEKQHKVLAVTCQDGGGAVEHQVLTLRGNGNLAWRMTECGVDHSFPFPNCVCISGVLYYIAKASGDGEYVIVCFDVGSEKYSFVKGVKCVMPHATLVNYKGKLASLMTQPDLSFISETGTSLEMWILEDPEKHEWSYRVFNLPTTWTDDAVGDFFSFVGVTATNEFLISPVFPSDPFYIYYYNFVKESIRRVEIQGTEPMTTSDLLTFMNHVEDVMVLRLYPFDWFCVGLGRHESLASPSLVSSSALE